MITVRTPREFRYRDVPGTGTIAVPVPGTIAVPEWRVGFLERLHEDDDSMRTMNMFIGTMSTTTRFAEKKSKQEDDGIFFETFERIPSSVSFSFRSVQYSDSENDDDIYDDSRASFVSAVATPSLLRKIFGDDVIHVEEDDEEDDEEEEEEEEEEEKEDYSIWLEEPMSIKERRQKLLREMGVSGRRSIAISSRPIIESTIEVNKPVVIDLPSPVGVALSTAGSTRVRSRSDVGVSRWDPINGGLSRTCSAPPFFRRRGGDSNSETATATAWRFKFLERLQFRNGELGSWNDCSSGMASWVPGTIAVPEWRVGFLERLQFRNGELGSWNDCSSETELIETELERLQYVRYRLVVRTDCSIGAWDDGRLAIGGCRAEISESD
ncbi:hypothetical protein ZOSMA_175G00420 [Zostera marina]|uniref:Uncharacterized protein n=1 Tax=Zostera marina TaxID=29655 RepID=A0A0K9PS74_ZOSMR|nr:hypothetical protein ZOSMA_175G00420 [Zostera marina]